MQLVAARWGELVLLQELQRVRLCWLARPPSLHERRQHGVGGSSRGAGGHWDRGQVLQGGVGQGGLLLGLWQLRLLLQRDGGSCTGGMAISSRLLLLLLLCGLDRLLRVMSSRLQGGQRLILRLWLLQRCRKEFARLLKGPQQVVN